MIYDSFQVFFADARDVYLNEKGLSELNRFLHHVFDPNQFRLNSGSGFLIHLEKVLSARLYERV